MATQYAFGKIVTNGLVLALDAADRNSYVSGSTTWNDLSGNNYNGTLTFSGSGTIPSFNTGSLGFTSASFAYITFGNVLALNSSSISGFVFGKLAKADSSYIPWIVKLASGGSYRLVSDSSNAIHFGIRDSASVYQEITTTNNAISTGSWYYMGFTHDFTTNSGSIYVNGALKVTGSFSVLRSDGNVNLNVGYNANNITFLSGEIASFQIYNRALTATEITQNYNAQKSRFSLT